MPVIDRATVYDALLETQDSLPDGERDITVRDSYSGRAMYGRECFAIRAKDAGQVSLFLLNLATLDGELARNLAMSMRTDAAGLGTIAYFPSYTISQ